MSGPTTNKLKTQGWFVSWSDWNKSLPQLATDLAKNYDIICLFAAKPDLSYSFGQKTFSGTGLEFSDPFDKVVSAISSIKASGSKVLLSVGSDVYNGWSGFNHVSVFALARDLGVDGVELDFETDKSQASILQNVTSQCLPYTQFETWICAPSTGTMVPGQGFDGSQYLGIDRPALAAYGNQIKGVNIMAYEAGPTYDPMVAYTKTRELCPTAQINICFEVPPESWGGHAVTESEVSNVGAKLVATGTNVGIGVWQIQRTTGQPNGSKIVEISKSIRYTGVPNPNPDPIPVPNPVPVPVPTPTSSKGFIEVYEVTSGKKIQIPVHETPQGNAVTLFKLEDGTPVLIPVKL